jgi:multicomponent Na+:H+ antiporter subunit G
MELFGYLAIICGLFFILTGILGMFRFPDFYTKMHAAGVAECCGAPMFLVGLACIQTEFSSSIKLIIAAILLILLGPVATHALGKAAINVMHKISKHK